MKLVLILLFCVLFVQGVKISGKYSKPEDCTPGTIWKDDCNTCTCDEIGKSACTLMACVSPDEVGIHEGDKHLQKRFVTQECIPGTTFKIACNTCRCSSLGIAACTRKACLD